MSHKPPTEQHRENLAAIYAALDVPTSAGRNTQERLDLLRSRVAGVRGVISAVLARPADDPGSVVRTLGGLVEDYPLTWTLGDDAKRGRS